MEAAGPRAEKNCENHPPGKIVETSPEKRENLAPERVVRAAPEPPRSRENRRTPKWVVPEKPPDTFVQKMKTPFRTLIRNGVLFKKYAPMTDGAIRTRRPETFVERDLP